MLKIFAAAALTIGVPLMVFVACYAVSYIPFVKRMLDVDENADLLTRVISGFLAILMLIIVPTCILTMLIVLFVAFYNLL